MKRRRYEDFKREFGGEGADSVSCGTMVSSLCSCSTQSKVGGKKCETSRKKITKFEENYKIYQ